MTTATLPSTHFAGELARDVAGDRFVIALMSGTLWLCVLTQKIALPGNIELPFPILAGAIGVLVARRRAVISPVRLMIFVAIVGGIAIEQALFASRRDISLSAMLIALGLYAMFVFVVPLGREAILQILRRFQMLALFIAAMVAIDWLVQLAGWPMPDLERIVPSGALYQAYNYVQPLTWQAAYMKPNGIFMLEASHTSQLLAMGVVLELCLFRRWRYLVPLLAAQLATFGGTGFVLLLASLVLVVPFYVRGRTLLALALLLAAAAGIASQTPVWDNFSQRSTEMAKPHSSGNGRLVEPYAFMAEHIANDRRTLVSGVGPGNAKRDGERTAQLVANPISKAVVEYGLFAGLIWVVLLHVSVIRTAAPGVAAFVVLMQYDFLNGALIVPIHLAYCYLLAAAYPRPGR